MYVYTHTHTYIYIYVYIYICMYIYTFTMAAILLFCSYIKLLSEKICVFTRCNNSDIRINLKAPCVLYIGQAFHCSPENPFYVFNQQIYFII